MGRARRLSRVHDPGRRRRAYPPPRRAGVNPAGACASHCRSVGARGHQTRGVGERAPRAPWVTPEGDRVTRPSHIPAPARAPHLLHPRSWCGPSAAALSRGPRWGNRREPVICYTPRAPPLRAGVNPGACWRVPTTAEVIPAEMEQPPCHPPAPPSSLGRPRSSHSSAWSPRRSGSLCLPRHVPWPIPDASEQHHRAIPPASALLPPAQMSCPGGTYGIRGS